MATQETNEESGVRKPDTVSGKLVVNRLKDRIEVYDETGELVLELGTISNPTAGEQPYGLKLYKAASIVVGENGTVTVGDNLTIYNNRIVLNDGSNDRMLIGFQAGGF